MAKKTDAERMAIYRKRVNEVREKEARARVPAYGKLCRALKLLNEVADETARKDVDGEDWVDLDVCEVVSTLEARRAEWLDEIVSLEDALNLKDSDQIGQKRVDAAEPIGEPTSVPAEAFRS